MNTIKVGSFVSKEKTTAFAIDQTMAKFSVQANFVDDIESTDLINRLCASIKSSPLTKLQKEVAITAVVEKKPLKDICDDLKLGTKVLNELKSTLKPFLQNLMLRHS